MKVRNLLTSAVLGLSLSFVAPAAHAEDPADPPKATKKVKVAKKATVKKVTKTAAVKKVTKKAAVKKVTKKAAVKKVTKTEKPE